MIWNQILNEVAALLLTWWQAIVFSVVSLALLNYARGKSNYQKQQGQEFRAMLSFEVWIMVITSFVIPYWIFTLLGPWITGLIMGIILFVTASILSVYLLLAPNNCHFTFIHEATVRFVSKGGAVVKVLIQWKGHTLDENGYVVPTGVWVKDGREVAAGTQGAKKYRELWHPLGGLRFYGLWPIYDIRFYDFAWTGINQAGELDPHPKESLGLVILPDDNYLNSATALETKPRENLPIDILQPLTIRIANPQKAIFAVENWLEVTQQAITSIDKDFAGAHSYEELIKEKDIGEQILNKAKEKGVIDELFDRYGVDLRWIRTKDIRVTDRPASEFQRLTLERFKAAQEARATVVKAKAESEKRAKETTGAIVQMLAAATGMSVKKVQEKINNDADLNKKIQVLAQDLVTRQVTGKGLIDIRVSGAEGMEKGVIEILAAFKAALSQQKPEKE